jgi:acylphosphatase
MRKKLGGAHHEVKGKSANFQEVAVKRRVYFHIVGQVQGVGFRMRAREEAERLSVRGWVCNLPDGNVEGEAEGPASAVDSFLAYCQKGPKGARVDQLTVRDEELSGLFSKFEIRR